VKARIFLGATALTAAFLVLAGCGSNTPAPGQPAASGTPAPGGSSSTPGARATTDRASPGPTAPIPPASQAACGTQGWGTDEKTSASVMTTAPLYLVRVGQHSCYDRVVFDINGPAPAGYAVKYVPQVLSDPKGRPVPVPGGAVLQVVVRAPIWGTDTQGHQPWRKPPAVGDDLVSPAQLAGWNALRAVKFAGSFEGQTTLAVGVRARLPFRVLVTQDASYRHIVLDIGY
jgi:hypothetical protein